MISFSGEYGFKLGYMMPSNGGIVYRYGFQGQERDDELKGSGNSYDFGARMYDSRLGRWLTVDPQSKKQPGWSPYKAMLDNPIINIDPNGETEYQVNIVKNEKTGKTTVQIKTANSIVYGGFKHVSSWYDVDYHTEYNYYDYASITVTTIAADGSQTVEKSTEILYENGIKDTDYFGSHKFGDTKTESWLTGEDHGQEVWFGIAMSGTPGSGAVGQDWSKNVIGSIDFDELNTILKRSPITKGYSPGSGSWQKMTKAKAKDWIKFVDSRRKEGEKIVKTVEETKKVIKENFVKSDSSEVCSQIGTEAKMKSETWHGSVVKRKGYEEKKK